MTGLVFCVEDDGSGFDAEQILNSGAAARGLGFTTMRERALLLNGTIDIASREGSGYQNNPADSPHKGRRTV